MNLSSGIKLLLVCSAACVIAIVAGCKADPVADPNDQDVFTRIYRAMSYEKPFYFDETVEKARSYALKNLNDLSEETMHEVKFTTPEFYQRRLFARGYGRDSSKRDISETCVVWKVPNDPDKNCIVVFGVGQRRLDDWYPVRAIVRPFGQGELEKGPAEDGSAVKEKKKKKSKLFGEEK